MRFDTAGIKTLPVGRYCSRENLPGTIRRNENGAYRESCTNSLPDESSYGRGGTPKFTTGFRQLFNSTNGSVRHSKRRAKSAGRTYYAGGPRGGVRLLVVGHRAGRMLVVFGTTTEMAGRRLRSSTKHHRLCLMTSLLIV